MRVPVPVVTVTSAAAAAAFVIAKWLFLLDCWFEIS